MLKTKKNHLKAKKTELSLNHRPQAYISNVFTKFESVYTSFSITFFLMPGLGPPQLCH